MRILIIDDDEQVGDSISALLTCKGHEVSVFRDSVHAISEIQNHKWDLAITDVYMPDNDGLDVLKAIRNCESPFPVIVMSGGGHQTLTRFDPLHCAEEFGARAVLHKPFQMHELLRAIISAQASDAATPAKVANYV